MNTRQLRYLVTIAQFGNLSRAAGHLGISQPALSKLLREWERSYGFSFFLSYRRQLTPTAVGRYYLDGAQRILDEQNRMLLTMRSLGGEQRQIIRLCTAPNRAAIIYSEIFHRFARNFPDIELTLIEQYAREQPGAILRGKADLALGVGPVSTQVSDIPFAREELLVALPAAHPLAARQSIRLRELRDTPFVLQGAENSIRSIADGLFREAGFEPVLVFQSNDVLLVDAMLHQGVGAGFVSRVHANPCEELRFLSLDPPVFQMVHIRYPKDYILTEAQKYLAGLLVRHRLRDSRYEPIDSPEVQELLNAEQKKSLDPRSEPSRPVRQSSAGLGGGRNDISFDTAVLKYMISIVDEGSLSKAAERLLLAQPALSRHLRNTEQMLGMQLFSRKHNRLYPTNVGKIFVNSARNILLIEEEMNAYIKKYSAGHGGRIFVHCDPILAVRFREKAGNAFSDTHPGLRISLVEENADKTKEALLNASTDIGLFLTRNPTHTILKYEILGETELVYCADPGHPRAPGEVFSSAESLMLAFQGTTLRKAQDRLIGRLFRNAPPTVAEADFSILRKLSALGGGDTILPLGLFSQEAERTIIPFSPPERYYLVLASNPGRTLPSSARKLMDLIRKAFRDFPRTHSSAVIPATAQS